MAFTLNEDNPYGGYTKEELEILLGVKNPKTEDIQDGLARGLAGLPGGLHPRKPKTPNGTIQKLPYRY